MEFDLNSMELQNLIIMAENNTLICMVHDCAQKVYFLTVFV
jgi:hypothetical protein